MSLALLKQLAAALPALPASPEDVTQSCKHHILRSVFFRLVEQRGGRADSVGPLPLPAAPLSLPEVAVAVEHVEQIGLFYEQMIGARLSWDGRRWSVTQDNSRRQSGSHYTPSGLAQEVTEQAIQAHGGPIVRVCDPAMGTGIFLLTAVRQLQCPAACLFGVDVDPDAVAVARMSLWLELRPPTSPAAFLADQLVVADALVDPLPADGFDLVLGNPPYVPFYGRASQASRFSKSYRQRIREQHGTIDGVDAIGGRVNLFLLFCVRATTALREGGIAALVLPDTVLTNASYAPLRAALCRSGRLRSAVRHGDDMFPDATVGTAVVTWGEPSGEGTARLGAVTVPHSALLSRPRATWLPVSTQEWRQRTISGSGLVPLGEVALVKDGLNTGSRRMRERLLCTDPDGDPSLRRCIEGKCIQPYRLDVGGLWVRYDTSLLSNGREGASLGNVDVFNAPKVVYRQTASHPIAAVDSVGLCYRNSAHGVVLKAHNDEALWALCGYLNAEAVRRHHQTVTGETRQTFPQVHVATMKLLPVPKRILDPADEVCVRLAAAARRADQEAVDAIVGELLKGYL